MWIDCAMMRVTVSEQNGYDAGGLTQSSVEQTQRKVNLFTVDGMYNQGGFTAAQLEREFHSPPPP